MLFRTEFNLPKPNYEIRYDSNILLIGSCFSVQIGKRLSKLKYNLLQNPAGITFNPLSILTTIRACKLGDSLPKDDFFLYNGLWRHSGFHGSYNHNDKNTCILNAQESINQAHVFISSISNVIITLGTAYIYEEINSGRIVNNCHKRPSQDFRKRLLSTEEIILALNQSIDLLTDSAGQQIQCIITISPVRHIKDGIIENQRSKARLIEATHTVIEQHNNVSYFPAYELLLDDLRDYRFYSRDLVHPSDEAIDYIYTKFQSMYLSERDTELRHKIIQINSGLAHRPQFPDSKDHRLFVVELTKRIELIMKDYPFISYELELEKLKSLHNL